MSTTGGNREVVVEEEMETWISDDPESEMETQANDGSETNMDTATNETVEPYFQKRRNTWPGSLQATKPQKSAEEGEDGDGEKSSANVEEVSPAARKTSTRRNAWGNMSYAEMITSAIESTPEKRMTLAQIYDWIVKSVPYFQDKGDNSSSASWKNSVRHNLSLHSQFTKLQNEGTGKSSWWVVKQDAAVQRRRARTMESGAFERKRGKGKLKVPGSAPATIDESQPGTRGRSGSTASSLGRLSPIQAEAEVETTLGEWNQSLSASGPATTQFLISGSQGLVPEAKTHFPVSGSSWQNFALSLNEPTSLVTASVPTTVLFVDQPVQVSTSTLPNDRGVAISQAPMIVLLASPQAAMPQYIQSTAVPASLPSNAISCISLKGVQTIPSCNNICVTTLAQKSSGPSLPNTSNSSVTVHSAPVSKVQIFDIRTTAPVTKPQSVSEHYLQFLKLLTSKGMQEYMRSKPGFSEKFRKLLLAKREKMMREMSQKPRTQPEGGTQRVNVQQELTREFRSQLIQHEKTHLEECMNSITLNNDDVPLPYGLRMTQNGSLLPNVDNEAPQQLENLDIDIDQVINQELEHDLLLDFNFDSLAGDFNCDDDFLGQF